ncbi:MAG: glycosyltransferase family 2 protein [Acidobacteria bacterium]|nr:glycosyltransferase family 2 protein [Acidobacteriota bacterium]MBI3425551.1 glycosyltransferase family 2 protein [Acidobacteriota bacterium]
MSDHSLSDNNALPFVSVVMPVRNEAGFIARSLGCVLAQDYPRECLEIIVADGRSTDATRELIQQWQAEHSNLHLVDNPGQIAPTGLNAAIAHARGEIIVRVDGHCEIAPDYVRNCVRHLREENVEGVGGPLETIGTTLMAAAIAAAMSSPFGVGGSAFRTIKDRTLLTDTVAFPAYTRAALQRAGRFDEEMVRNQDDEYNYRLRKLGGRILLAADVRARYYSRSSLQSLFKQYFQYGYWKVRVLQKHPRQMSARQFIPPLFVASLVVALLLAALTSWGWLLAAALVGSYALANLAAAVLTAAQSGWRHLFLLPPVFLALHLSYGAGFLTGLIKFARYWRASS